MKGKKGNKRRIEVRESKAEESSGRRIMERETVGRMRNKRR